MPYLNDLCIEFAEISLDEQDVQRSPLSQGLHS